MGNSCSTCIQNCTEIQFYQNKTNLIVATLNYGGILKSPFEFYSDEEMEEKKLSNSFSRLLPIYIKNYDPNKFQWDIGKIDHKLQQQRYTPLYNPMVGIQQSSKKQKLVTAKKFQQLWSQHFKAGTQKVKVQPEPTQTQKYNMMLFDIISYHAIIDHVYELTSTQNLSEMDKELNRLDCSRYQNFMNKKFSKSFLNQPKKIQKVIQSLNQIDVVFLQQPTKLLIDALMKENNFFVKHSGAEGSMIIIRKEKFIANNDFSVKKIHQFSSEYKYFDLNGNTDAVAIVIDKFIFVSAHLSSKQGKNLVQVKALKAILNKTKKDFAEYRIVLGADTNSYVDSEGLQGYQIYPKSKQNITTSKKRTFLQPQFKKANKQVEECKDHIIASCSIKNSSVETIDLKKLNGNELLPTDKHPFDHFMVVTEINR